MRLKIKRFLIAILCVVLCAFTFAACDNGAKPSGGTPGGETETGGGDTTSGGGGSVGGGDETGGGTQNPAQDEEDNTMLCKTDAYKPFWKEKLVRDESVVMVLGDDGRITGKLLFAPTEVISVKNYTSEKTYAETEYTIEGNTIIATPSSTMPYFTEDQLEGKDLDSLDVTLDTYNAKATGEKIVFVEGPGIMQMQTMVTYKYEAEWTAKPTAQPEAVETAINKLKETGSMELLMYGDSIAAGCHSSYGFNFAPYQVPFGMGVKAELESQFGGTVNFTNISVGGYRATVEGKNDFFEKLGNKKPDMFIIAFGMNDGSYRVDPDLFGQAIEYMIDGVRANNPECAIVLVSTVMANPLAPQDASQALYLPKLQEIAEYYFATAVVDMTTPTQEMFKIKKGVDLFANNINHPSDFLQRLYVTNIMSTIVKGY